MSKLTVADLKRVVREAIVEVNNSRTREFMSAMDANLNSQDRPKVGIFWYSPKIRDVFGVVAVDAEDQCKIEQDRNAVSCKELHKKVWAKHYNYNKFHEVKDNLFVGDYKDTPRGRIFYLKDTDEYCIIVGSWIHKYPEAIQRVKEAFDLTDKSLNISVQIGEHWEIGNGYGD